MSAFFNYFENTHGITSDKKIIQFLKKSKNLILCVSRSISCWATRKWKKLFFFFFFFFFETALGGEYFTHLKIIGSGKNKSYGIVTFSKFPIITKGEIIHPASSSLSIYTDVLIQKDTFRIYNNHLQSFRLMRMERSFINELTASDDKETMTEVKRFIGKP